MLKRASTLTNYPLVRKCLLPNRDAALAVLLEPGVYLVMHFLLLSIGCFYSKSCSVSLDSRFELFIRHGSQAVWPFYAFFFMTSVDFSPSYEFCSFYAMDNQRSEGDCGHACITAEWSDELVEDLIGFAHTHF